MRASLQRTYSVLEPFRYSGRDFRPGMEFNARRLDPPRNQLQRWVDGGYLCLPGQEPKPEPSEPQKAALESMGKSHEPLPREGEDFEE